MTTLNTETKKVPGGRTTLTIGDIFSFAQSINFDESYDKIKDPIGGASAILTPGTFNGDADAEILFTTDATLLGTSGCTLLVLTNGDLSTQTATLALQDTATPTTKTASMANSKVFAWGIRKSRHDLVRMRLAWSWPALATWA